jgi:undecaprenyl-diphosphatase
MQLETRLPFRFVKPVSAAGILLAAITVLFRFLSGVHWFTDILGGILISASLLFLFAYFFYNSISD